MTQKGNLFKGQKKQKTIPPNRHGKLPHVRKGKRVVKPSKMTKDMDADRLFGYHGRKTEGDRWCVCVCVRKRDIDRGQKELTKFINQCNEIKAATIANKDGGQLNIVKLPPESASDVKE
ncbi:hypothetical protein SCA6_015493 [Theobroma cacao]